MRSTFFSIITVLLLGVLASQELHAQRERPFRIIAYYAADAAQIDRYPVEKLTHIIFSFCHLRGNRLAVDNARDSLTIQKLVSLKRDYPGLKVLLSLGGWGGCQTCSDVFSTETGRTEFAASVRVLAAYFNTDGIDLDWEYPAIQGPPGHPFHPADKGHFTALLTALRTALGPGQEISFAAGGFQKYLETSIDWPRVMATVDYVNLMTYDLVNGATPHTGHHTPLYGTNRQPESVDACVRYLQSIGVPPHQMVIGAAFYGRSWEGVEDRNNGLYQPGRFKSFLPYRRFETQINAAKGFVFYTDSVAAARYAYNKKQKIFATFDDAGSIKKKTRYAIDKGLGGIMFWELSLDKPKNGYLDLIAREAARPSR